MPPHRILKECQEVFKNLADEIKDLKENHLAHIQDDIAELKEAGGRREGKLDAISKIVFAILGSLIFTIAAGVIILLIERLI